LGKTSKAELCSKKNKQTKKKTTQAHWKICLVVTFLQNDITLLACFDTLFQTEMSNVVSDIADGLLLNITMLLLLF